MKVSKNNKSRDGFFTLKSLLATMNCWHSFSKPENLQFEFTVLYSKMVQRLFTFIEAWNLLQHLSSAQDLMEDFIVMDWMKHRKARFVFIADMKSLEV